MRSLSVHPNRRRLAAAAVLAVYGFLLSLGAVSDLSHGMFHLIDRIQERQAMAAALGLVHLADRSGYTHTHDGVTHSHAGAVDALLAASERTDTEHDAAAPLVKLAVHAPSTVVYALISLAVGPASAATDARTPEHPRALPPLPPPRG